MPLTQGVGGDAHFLKGRLHVCGVDDDTRLLEGERQVRGLGGDAWILGGRELMPHEVHADVAIESRLRLQIAGVGPRIEDAIV